MKYGFIGLLLFVACFHFLFPYFYFERNGFHTVYQSLPPILYDHDAWIKVLVLNVGSLFLASAIIFFIPINQKIKTVGAKFPHVFYVFTCLWGAYFLYKAGGFAGVIQGRQLGTWGSYIGIFLGSGTAFTLTLVFFENSNVFLLGGIQILTGVLYGSRSVPVIMIVNLFILYASDVSFKKLRNFVLVTFISGLFSLFLFNLASEIRDIDWSKIDTEWGSGDKETRKAKLDILQTGEAGGLQVVGRISMLETGMLPIIFKDKKINPEKLSLFYEKYSLPNQLDLFKNYFFPKKIKNMISKYFPHLFDSDILPNQYYREIFLNASRREVQGRYLSINITLPVYIYMYTNTWIAILLSSLVLIGFYLLINFTMASFPILSLILFFNAYCLIYFFDLTDVLVTILRAMLTGGVFYLFYKIGNKVKKPIS
jgi:hypothetical protein